VGTVRAQPAAGGDGGRADDGAEPVIQCMKWGLVPSFTGKTEKPDHFRMVCIALRIGCFIVSTFVFLHLN
jgi:hypothetical protein